MGWISRLISNDMDNKLFLEKILVAMADRRSIKNILEYDKIINEWKIVGKKCYVCNKRFSKNLSKFKNHKCMINISKET